MARPRAAATDDGNAAAGTAGHPKVVSEMLGHASVSITLDIYSHVLPDIQEEAAAAMAVALGW